MINYLKRLWHSISFRLTLIIIFVFMITVWLGGKSLDFTLSMATNSMESLRASRSMSDHLGANTLQIVNAMKAASMASDKGLSRADVIDLCRMLKEQEFADSVYFFTKTSIPELQACRDSVADRDTVCWSEPYRVNGRMIVSVMTNTRKSGVLCADISLVWLNKLMDENKPSSQAVLYLISPEGRFIMASDSTLLGEMAPPELSTRTNDGFSVNVLTEDDEPYSEQNGKEKPVKKVMTSFGKEVPNTGWYFRCATPPSSTDNEFSEIVRIIVFSMLSLMAFFLLILILFFVRRSIYPLSKITGATQQIAKGNFNVELPRIRSHTEIRQLRDSFEVMQKELSQYVEDLKVTTEQKVSMERDLQIAHEIQQGLIPQQFPAFPERKDLDIYGLQIPAKTVGGDLFDFFMRDEKLFFCIGDVSGKGVPAALFMAVTCRLFRHLGRTTANPVEIVTGINNELSQGNERNMFCTLWVGVLDMATGWMTFCNAGHNQPILIHNHACNYMEPKVNIPAGVFDGFEFQGESMKLHPGDSLFMYTDGVTEAENRMKDLYGDDVALAAVASQEESDMETMAKSILKDVQKFADGAEQSDDLTILCLKYHPKAL